MHVEPAPKTGTPEFKEFFRESKVVDENGAPRVVYHGTRASEDFSEFSTDGPPAQADEESVVTGSDATAFMGAHFAQEPHVANKFAAGSDWMKSRYWGDGEKPRVMPVYLSIENPKIFDSEQKLRNFIYDGKISDEFLLEEAMQGDGIDPIEDEERAQEWYRQYDEEPEHRRIINEAILSRFPEGSESAVRDAHAELGQEARSTLEAWGHDGVRYKNEVEGGTSWIAFDPTQIKSAIGNSGKFDPDDPNILADAEPPKAEAGHVDDTKNMQLATAIYKANSRYQLLTPHEITHGHCYEWAEEVTRNLPDAKRKEVDSWKLRGKADIPYHAWVEFKGKAYDAEAENGVADWKELPFFKKHSNQAVMAKLESRTVPSRAKLEDDKEGIQSDAEKQPTKQDDKIRLSGDHAAPEPGTLPIPPGTVRFYHYTHGPDDLPAIREQGLLKSRGRGDDTSYSGPSAGVWASTKKPNTYDLRRVPYVEYYATPEEISHNAEYPDRWKKNTQTGEYERQDKIDQGMMDEWASSEHHVIMYGDVPTAQILAIHEPWMDHARHLIERWDDPGMEHFHDPKELEDWQGDAWRDFSKAIEYAQKLKLSGAK
jgi:hypothetical protein